MCVGFQLHGSGCGFNSLGTGMYTVLRIDGASVLQNPSKKDFKIACLSSRECIANELLRNSTHKSQYCVCLTKKPPSYNAL